MQYQKEISTLIDNLYFILFTEIFSVLFGLDCYYFCRIIFVFIKSFLSFKGEPLKKSRNPFRKKIHIIPDILDPTFVKNL